MDARRKFFQELHNATKHSALSRKHNPILKRINNTKERELKDIISNYSCLSNRAIHYLTTALIYSYQWEKLYKEIEDNIEEEKGSKTKGIPHLHMMREGYNKELGIDTSRVKPFLCTKKFLDNMNAIFLTDNVPYVAGAVLAFESLAIEEFHIIDQIIQKYLSFKNKQIHGMTKEYIDGHKLFELDHSSRLERAIMYHTDSKSANIVRSGYLDVCYEMNDWWIKMNSKTEKMYHKSNGEMS